jgi:HK97 gp10 family phage protein
MARVTTTGGALQGTPQLVANLNALAAALGDGATTKLGAQAVRAGAKPILNAAKAGAPVGPRPEGTPIKRRTFVQTHHKISTSLVIKKGKSKLKDAVTYMIGTGHAFHAIFVDRGTVYQHAQPFMERALAASKDEALNAMADTLSKGIARVARRNGVTL